MLCYKLKKVLYLKRYINNYSVKPQNIEINKKSNFLSTPLKLISSRMSPRASHRRHQYAILPSSSSSFSRRLFLYISLRTRMSRNVHNNRSVQRIMSNPLIDILVERLHYKRRRTLRKHK